MSLKNSDKKELKTFNVKKDLKRQAKKRKLEAFLNLVRKDVEQTSLDQKSGSFTDSYKALKDELRKYQKKDAVEPSFYLTQDGTNALVHFSAYKKGFVFTSPLFVADIYNLLLRSLIGDLSPFPVRWAKLKFAHNISKTVLIEIEGVSQHDVLSLNSTLGKNCDVVSHALGIISPYVHFATEFSTLHLATEFNSSAKKNYGSLFPIENFTVDYLENPSLQIVSKLHLLLSPIQLAMEHFPLPKSVFEDSKSDGYIFTKESYTPATAKSPMFALDCEMCKTASGNAVTRIAIVNENLETVYHKLIKPEERILNYMTKYSGITEKMLRNVETRLADVQEDLRKILPSDAILCGQSLNCDLHALKMIHPYVIDTSIIFNEFGARQRKTSLKQLTQIHLNEVIQDSKSGHNPVEDSMATMKLVQLKLKSGIGYGDLALPSDTAMEPKIHHNPSANFYNFAKLNSGSHQDGFFAIVAKFSQKKICLIGSEDNLNNYPPDFVCTNVTKIDESSLKKVIKTTVSNLDNYDLIMSHLTLGTENSSVVNVNEGLKEVYDSLPAKTLFLLILSGKNDDYNFKPRFCMVVLKKSESN